MAAPVVLATGFEAFGGASLNASCPLSGQSVRSAFMHLPLLPQQAAALAGQPSMAVGGQVRGACIALGVARRHAPGDRPLTDGALA